MAFYSPPSNKRFLPFSETMSSVSSPPRKTKHSMNALNNNVSPKRQACDFTDWFQKLIDTDRSSLGLYIADDAVLQWFGRTVKTKKKINDFLKYVMHCTSHRFMSVEPCGPIAVRGEKEIDTDNSNTVHGAKFEVLATPLQEDPSTAVSASARKRPRSFSSSPEDGEFTIKKRTRNTRNLFGTHSGMDVDTKPVTNSDNSSSNDKQGLNGDCEKVEDMTVIEEGQGDCLPSTSGSDLRLRKQPDLLTQLPRNYAEAKCIIEFSKTRNKRGADLLKWERQCKLEMAYTEDPTYAGEYIIWTVVYSDNNKCRRNLLAEFDAVSREVEGQL